MIVPAKKTSCRVKCAAHLNAAGVHATLFMDHYEHKRYMGLYYEEQTNRYWLVRNFRDAEGKEWTLSEQLQTATEVANKLPIDKLVIMC